MIGVLRKIRTYSCGMCLLILALGCLGCRKKQGIPAQEIQTPRVNQLLCEEQLSSLTDISLPLGLTKHQFKNTDIVDQHIIDYYSSFEPSVIQDFYELDMERLGWRLLSKFVTENRIVLLFDKPTTWCIVSINQHTDTANTASQTTIFVGPKVTL